MPLEPRAKEPRWQPFKRGDLVYGVDKVHAGMGLGRAEYLSGQFKGGRTIEHYHTLLPERMRMQPQPKDYESFVAALREHPKFRLSIDGEFTNANVRMKDKGGLYWATRNKKYVHFILDGLNIEQVVKKNFEIETTLKNIEVRNSFDRSPPGEPHKKNRSITGAELRWIYRNRHDPGVKEYIQFWLWGEQCPPPWVEYVIGVDTKNSTIIKGDAAGLWAQYVVSPYKSSSSSSSSSSPTEKESKTPV